MTRGLEGASGGCQVAMPRSWTVVAIALALLSTGLAGCIGSDDPGLERDAAGAADEGQVFSNTSVFAGDYNTEEPRTFEAGSHEVGEQSVTLVESDLDGTDIMIYVMRPDVIERGPADYHDAPEPVGDPTDPR